MTGGPFRGSGGRIDRSRILAFSFDGRRLTGHPGDTLASALLAAGVRVAGRSFKYHRPRGLLAAGVEEPNVLVSVGEGGRLTTNLRATEVELHDGLQARSLNRWPTLGFDLGAINDLLGAFLPAGFYYKSFIWPSWRVYEGPIRRAAGIGRPAAAADPDRYETRYAHCDVLVVGAGPAGLAAARSAAAGGAEVLLCEQDTRLGGSLLWRGETIDGQPSLDWVDSVGKELAVSPHATVLTRTTAIAYQDHNLVLLVQRSAGGAAARERLWAIRARSVILATGSVERPMVFPGNDRPGVMLASAAAEYAVRFGALAGRRAVVFANNDTAYRTASLLLSQGMNVVALADSRADPPASAVSVLAGTDVRVLVGATIVSTRGRAGLRGIELRSSDGARRIDCDCVLMSGGWSPTVHLFSQSGGRLRYDAKRAAFLPDASVQAERSVGGANGVFDLSGALAEGEAAGAAAGSPAPREEHASAPVEPEESLGPVWSNGGAAKAFVDFQGDVTDRDIDIVARENLTSVEHLKRYTALGMGTDQGKTANVNGLTILGELSGRSPEEVGTTRYRPPYTPTSLAAFGGRCRGALFRPPRRTPLHAWHQDQGAVFEDLGGWLRPDRYGRDGETREMSMAREALAVRQTCGLLDASSLGKIEVVGPDAAAFLDRVYAVRMSTLRPGHLRYGLMLNELGVIIDDGVAARLGPEHFLLTTTTGGAERIAAWLEEWLQCEWRFCRVIVAPVTADWGVATLAGPVAAAILAAAGCDFEPDPAAFPHMTCRAGRVAGIEARIARVSFTGEASYEISVRADEMMELWDALFVAGDPHGLAPIGIGALMLLRTEKGYIHVGTDTDGSTVPADIGWTTVARRSDDFIGKRSLAWEVNRRADRLQLVGLAPVDAGAGLVAGEHLRAERSDAAPTDGFITSAGFSPTLGRQVALALVRGGRGRTGEVMRLAAGGARVRVDPACAFDPAGERLR